MNRIPFVALFLLAACSDSDQIISIEPVSLTEDAIGHYCQMNVLAHAGPKAQVHLADSPQPIWFVQIRDAFAFDRMPEQDAKIAKIFVSDMGAAEATWTAPGKDNWMAATDAVYVVGSRKRGGMGAPDFIPFADADAALKFTQTEGGSVIEYNEISDALVLAPVEVELDIADGDLSAGEPSQ